MRTISKKISDLENNFSRKPLKKSTILQKRKIPGNLESEIPNSLARFAQSKHRRAQSMYVIKRDGTRALHYLLVPLPLLSFHTAFTDSICTGVRILPKTVKKQQERGHTRLVLEHHQTYLVCFRKEREGAF